MLFAVQAGKRASAIAEMFQMTLVADLNRLDIWSARLDEVGWAGIGELPADERARAAKMREGRVRNRWVAARWALRGAVACYLDEDPAALELSVMRPASPASPTRTPRSASTSATAAIRRSSR